ncbi:hypothetical protein B0H16DRAFT_1777938 [Mycena metata]|uniref:Uncharacterized protein n=1 Tax=Mycena metata TaxID=1033252 RepID=A0AAD7HV16_9AGAR|nr:hypothetical protein B0H16DRAFT_1777938 [Mycena metata]
MEQLQAHHGPHHVITQDYREYGVPPALSPAPYTITTTDSQPESPLQPASEPACGVRVLVLRRTCSRRGDTHTGSQVVAAGAGMHTSQSHRLHAHVHDTPPQVLIDSPAGNAARADAPAPGTQAPEVLKAGGVGRCVHPSPDAVPVTPALHACPDTPPGTKRETKKDRASLTPSVLSFVSRYVGGDGGGGTTQYELAQSRHARTHIGEWAQAVAICRSSAPKQAQDDAQSPVRVLLLHPPGARLVASHQLPRARMHHHFHPLDQPHRTILRPSPPLPQYSSPPARAQGGRRQTPPRRQCTSCTNTLVAQPETALTPRAGSPAPDCEADAIVARGCTTSTNVTAADCAILRSGRRDKLSSACESIPARTAIDTPHTRTETHSPAPTSSASTHPFLPEMPDCKADANDTLPHGSTVFDSSASRVLHTQARTHHRPHPRRNSCTPHARTQTPPPPLADISASTTLSHFLRANASGVPSLRAPPNEAPARARTNFGPRAHQRKARKGSTKKGTHSAWCVLARSSVLA